MVKRTIIPHRCNICDCELWFNSVHEKNYRYKEDTKGYYYVCWQHKNEKRK